MARCDITVKMVVPTRGSLLDAIRAADTDDDARSFKMILRGEGGAVRDGKLYFRSPVPTSIMKRINDAALDPMLRSAPAHHGRLPEPGRPTP
jgi:hypothetical protein